MTTTRQDTPFPNLCQFQFVDGRYCGLPSQSSSGGFCRSHNNLNRRKPPVEEDLTGIMMSLTSESGLDLHTALEKVFLALAGNRISARRAATFGYLAQLILSSQQEAARKSQPAAGSKPLGKPSRVVRLLPSIHHNLSTNLLSRIFSANFARNFPLSAIPAMFLRVATTTYAPDAMPTRTPLPVSIFPCAHIFAGALVLPNDRRTLTQSWMSEFSFFAIPLPRAPLHPL